MKKTIFAGLIAGIVTVFSLEVSTKIGLSDGISLICSVIIGAIFSVLGTSLISKKFKME